MLTLDLKIGKPFLFSRSKDWGLRNFGETQGNQSMYEKMGRVDAKKMTILDEHSQTEE